MDKESPIIKLEELLSEMGLSPMTKKDLFNALHKMLEDGGMFTVTLVNNSLNEMGLPEIEEEVLDAFVQVLVHDFNYSVTTDTLH